MISENAILYDLLKMLYIHSVKKEAQQTEMTYFTTFAFLIWDSLLNKCVRLETVQNNHNSLKQSLPRGICSFSILNHLDRIKNNNACELTPIF